MINVVEIQNAAEPHVVDQFVCEQLLLGNHRILGRNQDSARNVLLVHGFAPTGVQLTGIAEEKVNVARTDAELWLAQNPKEFKFL